MSKEVVVQRFRSKRLAWTTLDATEAACRSGTIDADSWYPIVRLEPKTIRADIFVRKTAHDQWSLRIDGELIDTAENAEKMRSRFDRVHRFKYIRPPALKLAPADDVVDELLANLVHPAKAQAGDYVLLFHEGSVLDVVQIRAVDKKKRFAKIYGDELAVDFGLLLPPTAYRKQQYRDGMKKLRAPISGALPANTSYPKYPDAPSAHVVGRPEVRLAFHSANRSSSDYIYVEFVLTNSSHTTIQLSQYRWQPEKPVSLEQSPFAYQHDRRLKTFSIECVYSHTLYPGSNERMKACIGGQAMLGEVRLFIPSGVMGGVEGTYTMLAFEAPAMLS